ncbi:MAG: SGNH/GDSL hydrolase family protein [Pseudonocardiaceae bacterium]
MGKTAASLEVAFGRHAGRLRWGGRVVALIAGVVGVLPTVASTAAAGPATITAGHVRALVDDLVNYVALGDSYSSGVGTGSYDAASGDCARSPLSYPPLWAAANDPAGFEFVACSGATTGDVRGKQISALSPGTNLVTITIGGNDVGFGPVLQTCTFAQSDRTCIAAVNTAEAYTRSVMPGRLARIYADIRSAAPDAQVIVLGYPRLFDLAPSCAEPLVPNLVRREKLNEGSDVLNTVIQKTVSQQSGFSFSDVRGRFAGHEVCSADPWINGPTTPWSVGPYHPNRAGYRNAYLDALDTATDPSAAAA